MQQQLNEQVIALQQELLKQKKLLSKIISALCFLILLLLACFISSFKKDTGDIIKAKGIVIVDDNGRERILIGAPVPIVRSRVRTDSARVRQLWSGKFPDPDQYMKWYSNYNHSANGIIILDEQGFDKVCLGDGVPDANIGQRVGKQSGLVFCDDEGSERGGIGILNVGKKQNRVVMALDGANGTDATGVSVLEDGETGFFASGPGGYNLFMGAAPPDDYTKGKFFGLTVNKQQKNIYMMDFMDSVKYHLK